jgi:peptidyl-prolyl cis-trans isomerase C
MQDRHKRWMMMIAVGCALFLGAWQASAAEKEPGAGQGDTSGERNVVATVDGTPISRAHFERTLNYAREQLSRTGRPVDDNEIRERALDQLIGSELLYEESKREGISIDDKTVDEKLAQWKKQFPSEEEYRKALEEANLSEERMRADIKKDLAIQKLIIDKFVNKTTIPEKDMKDYYEKHPDMFKQPEQVQASHILVKTSAEPTESEKEEALKKIREIQEKVKAGEDFAELAKAQSQCPSSAKGGDLGYFGRGQMVPPFEKAAFSMKPGEVSDVVTTQFGFHLIKVTDKKPETTVPYDEMKDRISQFLKQEKVQKEVKELVDKLREKAKVEVFLKNAS